MGPFFRKFREISLLRRLADPMLLSLEESNVGFGGNFKLTNQDAADGGGMQTEVGASVQLKKWPNTCRIQTNLEDF